MVEEEKKLFLNLVHPSLSGLVSDSGGESEGFVNKIFESSVRGPQSLESSLDPFPNEAPGKNINCLRIILVSPGPHEI